MVHAFLDVRHVVFQHHTWILLIVYMLDFRLKLFFRDTLKAGTRISVVRMLLGYRLPKCLVSGSVSRYIVHVLHRLS